MANVIKIGMRVVDKTTGRHGKVDSFIVPWSFGYTRKTKARVVMDEGIVVDVEPHNLAIEEGYKEVKVDNVGINGRDNPDDKTEDLTPVEPPKPKRTRKPKADATEEIINATV